MAEVPAKEAYKPLRQKFPARKNTSEIPEFPAGDGDYSLTFLTVYRFNRLKGTE